MPLAGGLLFLLASFLISATVVPLMIVLARRNHWFDHPGERKVHARPLPRLGGVGIFVATWVSWGLFAWFYPNVIPYEAVTPFWALFVSSTLIWLLGLYDDLHGANAWKKLSVQVVAAAIVVSFGVDIRLLYNPVAGTDILLSSQIFIWCVSVAWIVVVTNAINLIDGLDGLAGGVCFITALTIFFISRDLGIPHLPYFALCLAGGCLGFLMYNFAPARIFLGDSGSLFLGFILACSSIIGTIKRSTAIVMFGPPLILALPMLDTVLAIFRRFLKKAADHEDLTGYRAFLKPQEFVRRLGEIFKADQDHIHHGLLKIGLSHRAAVIILYIVTAVLGITAYQATLKNHLTGTLVTFAVLGLALRWMLRKAKSATLAASTPVNISQANKASGASQFTERPVK